MIDALLADAGTPLSALDAIAFGAGPGSFTGLRIACGVAQGLGLAIDRPLIAVDSLSSIAWASGQPQVIACLDARMGEVYCAAYQIRRTQAGPHLPDVPDASIEVLSPPRVCAPDAVPMLPGAGWAGCGNGFAAHGAVLALVCLRSTPRRRILAVLLLLPGIGTVAARVDPGSVGLLTLGLGLAWTAMLLVAMREAVWPRKA